MLATRRTSPRGFTLVELLVVITIIALISAVALPVVLPALNERRVSEAARLLQAILAGTRDTAIRANAPRGIRLLPDPVFSGGPLGQPLAANRIIPIEPGPDYTEGLVRAVSATLPNVIPATPDPLFNANYLTIAESGFSGLVPNQVPNNPTNWYLNIRQGDKLRFNDSGNFYTIAGPVSALSAVNNPERFIAGSPSSTVALASQTGWLPDFLLLLNGQDDDGDGWIDEECDGIDNDGDGIIDPGFNGLDDAGLINGVMHAKNGIIDEALELMIGNGNAPEFEQEVFVGSQATLPPSNEAYTIFRRPVVSPGAREVTLSAGVVIDLTTWNASISTPAASTHVVLPERSRLPVDAYTGYVDVMIDQSGRVITPGAGSDGGGYYARSPLSSTPFYHFWLTEREGVHAPLWDPVAPTIPYAPTLNPDFANATTPMSYLLPMPKGTIGYTPMPNGTVQSYSTNPVYLTGERRLVTLFVKTGQIVSNSIQSFDVNDTNAPFYDAQAGIKEPL
jgi:prepilin-type N-terminal cleavage/methylation domain-containing protein